MFTNVSAFRSLPPPINPQSSPKVVRFPNGFLNYPHSTKSVSLSPAGPNFQSPTQRHSQFDNLDKPLSEKDQKTVLYKEKEVEVEFWKRKYEEINEENRKSANLDNHLDLLEEHRKKIDLLLDENAKLNKICNEKMLEIEYMKENQVVPESMPEEIHELHEENIRLNKENMELRSKLLKNGDYENIQNQETDDKYKVLQEKALKLLNENEQLKKELTEKHISEDYNEKYILLQDKVRKLLSENERLNNILNERTADIDFWKDKLRGMEENQENHIEELKRTLENNYQAATKMSKQQISYDVEALKLKIRDLEAQNSRIQSENDEAKELINNLNDRYSVLLNKVDDYEQNFIEKSLYNQEKTELTTQLRKMETNLTQVLSENEKLLSHCNDQTSELENSRKKYENLERNHSEHVKQLKRTWENSHMNTLEISVKEKTLNLKHEIESLELERENLLKYIRTIEEKNQENNDKMSALMQKFDSQRKRLVQLEAEKERVDVYQNKIREIEEQHLLELQNMKANLMYERESEQVLQLQEKIEVLSEELTKMNRALDEKNSEIFQWNEKFRTYEDFHQMKMRDYQQKIEMKTQHFRNENSGYIMDLEKKLEFLQEEKMRYIEEIEKWRGNSLELEKKLNNISIMENKLEIMGNQNMALNKNLQSQMQENMYWKGQVLEQEKLTQYLFELESKIRYLLSENDRLNKIIIMRCKDILGGGN